jgi:hypothetical protein
MTQEEYNNLRVYRAELVREYHDSTSKTRRKTLEYMLVNLSERIEELHEENPRLLRDYLSSEIEITDGTT